MPTEAADELEDVPESPRSYYEHMVELGWQRAERLALGFVAPGPPRSPQGPLGSERARADATPEAEASGSPGTRHDRVRGPIWGSLIMCTRGQLL